MKKAIRIFIAIVLLSFTTQAQDTWEVDQTHSKVRFSVSHLVVSELEGNFKSFEGAVIASKEDFSDAKFTFSIDVNSINTDNEKRDGHLRSEDFFYVEKFPKMTFESTSFEKIEGNKYLLKGNLTMRGVTKAIALDVKYGGSIDLGEGNAKAGFVVKGDLNRIDYGVAWNRKTKQGSWSVGEEVDIVIKLECNKVKM